MFGTCDSCGATCVRLFAVNRGDETGLCAVCIPAVYLDSQTVELRVAAARMLPAADGRPAQLRLTLDHGQVMTATVGAVSA